MRQGRPRNFFAQVFRYPQRAIHAGLREDDRKLFAAEATRQVRGTTRRMGDRGRDGPQAGVPRRMPVGVVVALEEVDIDEQERER